MANIKSAKKRILVNETKAARNKAIKSKVKTAVKKVEAAVALESVLVGNLVPYFINYKLRIREISTAKIVNSSGTRNLLL